MNNYRHNDWSQLLAGGDPLSERVKALEDKVADLVLENSDLSRKLDAIQMKDKKNEKKISDLSKEVQILAELFSAKKGGRVALTSESSDQGASGYSRSPPHKTRGFSGVPKDKSTKNCQDYLDKSEYFDTHSQKSSNFGSRVSLNSDISSGSSYKECLGEYDFVFELPTVKKAYINAKQNNNRFRESRCDGLYEDTDGYNFGLLIQPCGGENYFTFDKFLCLGLVCSKTKRNKDNYWPINVSFVLSLFNPENRHDILISKKRDREFTGPGAREWIYKFCSLNRIFGLHRKFDTPYTVGDKLCIGLKFI